MEAHFWSLHLNEADPGSSKFISNEAKRHPSGMTQEHKNTVAVWQEQEEWPSDDDAPAAAPDPSSEDGGLKPWSPGTSASVDPCPDDLVSSLNYSWRFGKLQCHFLRETCKRYGEGTPGTYSPREKPRQFSKAELARVPDTQLRCVAYRHEEFYCSRMRGLMLPDPQFVSTQGPHESCDNLRVWLSGTPESVSGETSLLAQVAHIPPVSHIADLRGNMLDEGRRLVSASRSRLLASFHML